jgi:hypothetical protein
LFYGLSKRNARRGSAYRELERASPVPQRGLGERAQPVDAIAHIDERQPPAESLVRLRRLWRTDLAAPRRLV